MIRAYGDPPSGRQQADVQIPTTEKLRGGVAALLGAMSSMLWMAIGVGLILEGLVVAQDQIWAWLRIMNTKKAPR